MPDQAGSLLGGRNVVPLTDAQVRSVANTFLGLDDRSAPKYDPQSRTIFRVRVEDGQEVSEIVFGPDIYPGTGVADPNSSLSMKAAVAHELCHHYRHADLTEINDETLKHIDEALTSLEAIQRFPRQLNDHDIRQLVADAMHRLQLFAQEHGVPPE